MNQPEPVLVTAYYSRTWQRFLGVPYRRYIILELPGRGCTQAQKRREIERMVRSWLECNEEEPSQKILIGWR